MESHTALTPQKAFIVPIILTVVMAIILFLPAGLLEFWESWVYLFEFSLLTFFIAAYFLKKSPELLQRRMRLDTKATTKRPPAVLNLFFLGFIIPGLDFRFGWSNVSLWTVIIANVLFCLGYMLVIQVFKENSYASTAIQTEKEQPVITTGPYALLFPWLLLRVLLQPIVSRLIKLNVKKIFFRHCTKYSFQCSKKYLATHSMAMTTVKLSESFSL